LGGLRRRRGRGRGKGEPGRPGGRLPRQLLAEDRAEVPQVPARARGEGEIEAPLAGAVLAGPRVRLPMPARGELGSGEVIRALRLRPGALGVAVRVGAGTGAGGRVVAGVAVGVG